LDIKSVDVGSAAERAGICAGDTIVSVNGEKLTDYVDYIYFCAQKKLSFRILRGRENLKLRCKNDEYEDLGLTFTQPLLGKKHICGNRCIFCFVDQLPRGMRKSLYLKDEDWRYSLVMGNYVTLSTITKDEISRIIRRKASPLYISVHTANEAQRRFMLGNKNAIPIRPLLKKLARRGICFHTQAVVCPGFNDGEYLFKTYSFLKRLYPAALSLAVVPVGLTGHRQGLCSLEPVTPQMALDTIKEVEKWQQECLNSMGTRFVFAADEYYLRAGLDLPPAESYEGFAQLENGVGLVAKFVDEAQEAFLTCGAGRAHVSVVTGQDAFPFINALAERAKLECGARVYVYAADNQTFGGGVGVCGLLGGRDILRAVSGKTLGDKLLIPASALREDNVFLDDMTLEELGMALNVPVLPAADGYAFVRNLCGESQGNTD